MSNNGPNQLISPDYETLIEKIIAFAKERVPLHAENETVVFFNQYKSFVQDETRLNTLLTCFMNNAFFSPFQTENETLRPSEKVERCNLLFQRTNVYRVAVEYLATSLSANNENYQKLLLLLVKNINAALELYTHLILNKLSERDDPEFDYLTIMLHFPLFEQYYERFKYFRTFALTHPSLFSTAWINSLKIEENLLDIAVQLVSFDSVQALRQFTETDTLIRDQNILLYHLKLVEIKDILSSSPSLPKKNPLRQKVRDVLSKMEEIQKNAPKEISIVLDFSAKQRVFCRKLPSIIGDCCYKKITSSKDEQAIKTLELSLDSYKKNIDSLFSSKQPIDRLIENIGNIFDQFVQIENIAQANKLASLLEKIMQLTILYEKKLRNIEDPKTFALSHRFKRTAATVVEAYLFLQKTQHHVAAELENSLLSKNQRKRLTSKKSSSSAMAAAAAAAIVCHDENPIVNMLSLTMNPLEELESLVYSLMANDQTATCDLTQEYISQIANLICDYTKLINPGEKTDEVSSFFAPLKKVNEFFINKILDYIIEKVKLKISQNTRHKHQEYLSEAIEIVNVIYAVTNQLAEPFDVKRENHQTLMLLLVSNIPDIIQKYSILITDKIIKNDVLNHIMNIVFYEALFEKKHRLFKHYSLFALTHPSFFSERFIPFIFSTLQKLKWQEILMDIFCSNVSQLIFYTSASLSQMQAINFYISEARSNHKLQFIDPQNVYTGDSDGLKMIDQFKEKSLANQKKKLPPLLKALISCDLKNSKFLKKLPNLIADCCYSTKKQTNNATESSSLKASLKSLLSINKLKQLNDHEFSPELFILIEKTIDLFLKIDSLESIQELDELLQLAQNLYQNWFEKLELLQNPHAVILKQMMETSIKHIEDTRKFLTDKNHHLHCEQSSEQRVSISDIDKTLSNTKEEIPSTKVTHKTKRKGKKRSDPKNTEESIASAPISPSVSKMEEKSKKVTKNVTFMVSEPERSPSKSHVQEYNDRKIIKRVNKTQSTKVQSSSSSPTASAVAAAAVVSTAPPLLLKVGEKIANAWSGLPFVNKLRRNTLVPSCSTDAPFPLPNYTLPTPLTIETAPVFYPVMAVIKLAERVKVILREIESLGYWAFATGSCPRDLLLGFVLPHDADIFTNCPIDKLTSLPSLKNIKKHEKKTNFFQLKKEGDSPAIDISCLPSNFTRKQGLPFADFTINGLSCNAQEEVFSMQYNFNDIYLPHLVFIGDPDTRLKEDPILIFRAIRLSNATRKWLTRDVTDAINKHAREVIKLPFSVYIKNIKALFLRGMALTNYNMLNAMGIFSTVLPFPERKDKFQPAHFLFKFIRAMLCQIDHEYPKGSLHEIIALLILEEAVTQINPIRCTNFELILEQCVKSFYGHFNSSKHITKTLVSLCQYYQNYKQSLKEAEQSMLQSAIFHTRQQEVARGDLFIPAYAAHSALTSPDNQITAEDLPAMLNNLHLH